MQVLAAGAVVRETEIARDDEEDKTYTIYVYYIIFHIMDII